MLPWIVEMHYSGKKKSSLLPARKGHTQCYSKWPCFLGSGPVIQVEGQG